MEQQHIRKEAPPDTKRIVQQLHETTGIAASTMEKLQQQGDQMNRVIGMNEETGAALHDADRLTKQLSVRGRISNLFKRKSHLARSAPVITATPDHHKDDKNEKKQKRVSAEQLAKDPADDVWKDRSKEDPFHGHSSDLDNSQMQLMREQDEDLDQMSDILSTLKEMSMATSSELKSQSKKIDHIDQQVDNNLYSLNKTTKKLAR